MSGQALEVRTPVGEFTNEPLTDFSVPTNRQRMQEGLKKVASELGREYDIRIGTERIRTEEKIRSTNPSHPDQAVGIFNAGTKELTARAVEEAHGAFQSWKEVPFEQRADYLFRAGELMRRRKLELAAWMVYEVGKIWPEADADIAEAIDFCEFYGREMLRLGPPQPLTPVKGEKNHLQYIPLGVGAVIPPWNFPGAIMVGMTTAAIVTGNTVVLKPSSDSPTMAAKFAEVMEEVGLPPGVLNFLPGRGSQVGDPLVMHPLTRFVAFTGSKEVGLRISELASQPQPGLRWIRRAVLEMGGKDAIIVDNEADLDAAVEGVTVSAFGYQGQKCSACSRAIVVRDIYPEFLKRLEARVRKIFVGPAEDPNNYMGPVINQSAMKSIQEYIEIGKKEGQLITGGGRAGGDGYFLEPTVIADVSPKARIAQEEIFGPVLAVIPAQNYDHALEIANGTEFGLTGGVYSRNPEKLRKAAESFHVGNLYFNRKCTGALVGAHPFGGFNMSGTDSKTGGKDYLLLFLQAKTIAEKITS
ncbi:MAG: L-glutamate gamma-semialdehyde dehydrogenase [Acidobacteria bacterium]|nr:L-glutamate gamma-semialdehyde dehydrogenase [Acidobacteriota bacterium]